MGLYVKLHEPNAINNNVKYRERGGKHLIPFFLTYNIYDNAY